MQAVDAHKYHRVCNGVRVMSRVHRSQTNTLSCKILFLIDE